jgi:exosortase
LARYDVMDNSALLDPAIAEGALLKKERVPGPLQEILAFLKTPTGVQVVVAFVALVLAFLPLFKHATVEWFAKDSYYTHAPLVPLIAAYICYMRRDKLATIPVKGSWLAIVPLLGVFYVAYVASRTDQSAFLSILFVMASLFSVWFIAGARWTFALAPVVGYLLFGLPVWATAIDTYTNPLQLLSTKIAYELLNLAQMQPYMTDTTTIALSRYNMHVAVACSGLKTTLALLAFTAMFVMISRLKLWANGFLVLMIIPFAVLINGLRIAMIGIVGNVWGDEAGHQFHDYSGYISLLVCFYVLMKVARALGWK